MNRRTFAALAALLIWFAVILQLVLMLRNESAQPLAQTLTRFFSYFTILINILAATYLTAQAVGAAWSYRPGVLTAVTGYILIVGISYQVLLRHVWAPQGWDRVADELLHTVNPVIPLIYWILYEDKQAVRYRQIFGWLIFPMVYLAYTLIRGSIAGWYPYHFVDVNKIGLKQTLINSAGLVLVFLLILLIMIALGKQFARGSRIQKN